MWEINQSFWRGISLLHTPSSWLFIGDRYLWIFAILLTHRVKCAHYIFHHSIISTLKLQIHRRFWMKRKEANISRREKQMLACISLIYLSKCNHKIIWNLIFRILVSNFSRQNDFVVLGSRWKKNLFGLYLMQNVFLEFCCIFLTSSLVAITSYLLGCLVFYLFGGFLVFVNICEWGLEKGVSCMSDKLFMYGP